MQSPPSLMTERIIRRFLTFPRPFAVEGFDTQAAGTYEVETVEETIDGLSFLAYRLVSASLVLPLSRHSSHSYQLVPIELALLRTAADGSGERRHTHERETDAK